MAAGVLERDDAHVVGAQDDDRLVEELVLDEVVRLRDLLEPAGHLPDPRPQLLGFHRVEVRVEVALLGDPVGMLHRVGHGRGRPLLLHDRHAALLPFGVPCRVVRLTGRYKSPGGRATHGTARSRRRRPGRRRRHHRPLPAVPRPRGRLLGACCSRPAAASAGTWFWNRYPGARFDSESYTYGYLFSKELFDEWEWQEHFAGQPETERYLNHVVDRFDLRRHIRFDAPVTSAVWDEASATWVVTTGDGSELRARFLIAATGVLSVPYLPDVPGRDDFRGAQHHTGRWPAEPVDFTGKRVAVVGTSSSGVQVVPTILDDVEHITVYQRTANWCTPLNNRPITPEEQAELRAGFEALRETLNTSLSGFAHPVNDARGIRRLRGRAAGVLREVVEQPGLHEAHEQLLRPALQRGGERRVLRLHRREDPRHRATTPTPRSG